MDFPASKVGASISVAFLSCSAHNEGPRHRNGGIFVAVSAVKHAQVAGTALESLQSHGRPASEEKAMQVFIYTLGLCRFCNATSPLSSVFSSPTDTQGCDRSLNVRLKQHRAIVNVLGVCSVLR